jgi:hypothetical protein
METPEVITRRAPDGNIFHDVKLKFLVRRLFDEYFDPVDATYKPGWIGWNWQYVIPHGRSFMSAVQARRGCYYPIVWNGGLFSWMGNNHPAFLRDTDVDAGYIPGGLTDFRLDSAPFTCGFKPEQ